MKKLLVFALVFAAFCGSATAETAWHYFAARFYGGVVENGGMIDSKPGYRELDMGSEAVYGLAFDMFMTEDFGLKFGLSQFANSASQLPSDPEYSGDRMDIDLEVTTLSVTGQRRFNCWDGLLAPWVGVGVDWSVIENDEREYLTTDSGLYREDENTKVSNGLGAHLAAGLDLYPVKMSSLALMLETRYTAYSSSGPFEGDLNGALFLIGLKWDFGQRAF